MEQPLRITGPASKTVAASVRLPASKSESNRALMINALCRPQGVLSHLSTAHDTVLMQRLLASSDPVLDVEDAGTTCRFLVAYLALASTKRTVTGTARMKQRPIKILVEALQTLGADITYLEQPGFLPVKIDTFRYSGIKKLKVRADVSSQYISALLMIAPVLPGGLELELEGEAGSRPYIDMTLALMARFGVGHEREAETIRILPQPYRPAGFAVEPDWSAASYWYSVAALAQEADIRLYGLKKDSLQGDRAIADLMDGLGVETLFEEDGIRLKKKPARQALAYNFRDCPDLAPTVIVLCAVKGINLTARGLESLRIKESDRIEALQAELSKWGARLEEKDKSWTLRWPGSPPGTEIQINTWQDHRMAMAFAPLALLLPVTIENPAVVNKSYPGFWEDLKLAGFQII